MSKLFGVIFHAEYCLRYYFRNWSKRSWMWSNNMYFSVLPRWLKVCEVLLHVWCDWGDEGEDRDVTSVQFSSPVVSNSATQWTAECQASLSITNSQGLLKLMSIELVRPSNHLIFCCPLLLSPSIFPSIRVFANESIFHIMWPKYWSFSFSISPSNEYSGLISLRMNWLDLLVVHVTLKGLVQHHSSKASILWHSAFFTVQLSYPCMTIGKTIALTRQTFVGKVLSPLFNMLSRFATAFLPRSNHLSISWLQSPSAVILEPPKIKFVTVSIVSPSICQEWWDWMPWS